jgi:ribosomal protein L7Ae-like RNA K-turn-binding protein
VAQDGHPIAERWQMDDRARGGIMRLLGLGVRSRNAVVGVEQVRDGAKRNKIVYAIVARDASRHSLDKLVPLLNARRVRFIEVPSAAELGAAVGRDSTAAVGIVDRQLADGIRKLAEASDQGPTAIRQSQEDV